jgi:hypothetical protein
LSAPVLSWLFFAVDLLRCKTTVINRSATRYLSRRSPPNSQPCGHPSSSPHPTEAHRHPNSVCSTLRANLFPEVTDLICRLPLPTLNLLTRGCSPWRPDAVISTTRGANKSQYRLIFQGPYGRHRIPRKHEVLFPQFYTFSPVNLLPRCRMC